MAAVVFGYTFVGLVLGVIAVLSANCRRVGLAIGAAAGLAGGLGLVSVFPAVTKTWMTRQTAHGADLFEWGLMITAAALGCVVIAAILGWVAGGRENS
jgi:hypothetical protein